MKPGRELDALIAEKVLKRDPKSYYVDFDKLTFQEQNVIMRGQGWTPDLLPSYSTDITAAWTITEKIENKTFIETIKVDQDTKTVTIRDLPRDDKEFTLQRVRGGWKAGHMVFIDWIDSAYGDTAPHAICLFALQLLEKNP